MLPLKNRLTKRKDFENVIRKGKGRFFENIGLKFLKNGLENTRIGFIIGLKFSKKAVARNEMRRFLRETIKRYIYQIERGYDILILARKKDKERINKEKIKIEIEQLLIIEKLINKRNN